MSEPGWTDHRYEGVVRLVGARTGLAFTPAFRGRVEAGIRRAMARAGQADVARYCRLLETPGDAFDDLIGELTVPETYFFRAPEQYALVRREILPEIRRRRGAGHAVRVWSAGCASGEETYSLAILFAEAEADARHDLHGTDVSRAALAKARAGTYGQWSLRGAGAALAHPYLRQAGDRWVVVDDIRRRVRFEPLNLALDTYPSSATGLWGVDLILCRNVLIYFDADTIRQVACRLFDTLADGGWLVTGASDPLLGSFAPFESVTTDCGIVYRKSQGAVPQSASTTSAPTPVVVSTMPLAPPASPGAGPKDWRAVLGRAQAAFDSGHWAEVVRLTRPDLDAAEACVLHVRAAANLDAASAERACAVATERHELSAELRYLWCVLLLDLGRHEDAAHAARCLVFLDGSLAAAHLVLGTVLRRLGDAAGARRAYRNARDLCAARPDDEPVPLADGETAGRLAAAAEAQIALLDAERTAR